METLLNKYNLEFTIHETYIELWRNGRTAKINLPIDESLLSVYLDLFCVYSPESTSQLKEKFPFFFQTPKPGDSICVKKIGDICDVYKIVTFDRFENNKIICFKNEKELSFDFYSIFDGEHHPSTSFWHNAK